MCKPVWSVYGSLESESLKSENKNFPSFRMVSTSERIRRIKKDKNEIANRNEWVLTFVVRRFTVFRQHYPRRGIIELHNEHEKIRLFSISDLKKALKY